MRTHGYVLRRAVRASYILPPSETAARWARHLTAAYLTRGCGQWVSADQVDDARLVVSELVTNATRHGRGNCRLRLSVDHGRVTVEVHDHSPVPPRLRTTGPTAPDAAGGSGSGGESGSADVCGLREDGRGIAMVRELSRRFSVLGSPGGGKTVQAVLTC
ncbi:ATP-binding protein [Streptomyces corynorhini]|uniref:ATP-binding protein n=1 Tax=Streptomyces corynorhini TaxID=2282652 RepID=A0A370B6E1_9ACTN|nr:ATP-binding protein [Streptomyces corynorhini]RDG36232.1 ATP-binding protein [Streptomyces corynorhini]